MPRPVEPDLDNASVGRTARHSRATYRTGQVARLFGSNIWPGKWWEVARMKKGFGFLMLVTWGLLALAACAPASPQTPVTVETRATATEATAQEVAAVATAAEAVTVTLMTHDSFNVSEEVIAAFEAQTGIKVKLLPSGDAGAALNQAILSRNNPLADVFFGVDNTFLGRALGAGIFEPCESPLLEDVPDELELDPEHRLSPIDYGDVCLNYDKAWFKDNDLEPPANLEALTDVAYKGLTVVENPATSSSWQPSVDLGRMVTWTTGGRCAKTTCWWWMVGKRPIGVSSRLRPMEIDPSQSATPAVRRWRSYTPKSPWTRRPPGSSWPTAPVSGRSNSQVS